MMYLPNSVLSIDFETTGLIPNYDYPTSFSAVVFDEGEPTGDVFTRKIVPGDKAKISLEALMVQGLDLKSEGFRDRLTETIKDLFPDNAVTAKECMEDFAKWSTGSGYNLLPNVAHMASFDWPFFEQKLAINRSVHLGNALSPIWICTKALACHLWPDKAAKNLDSVLLALGLPKRDSMGHDSLEDAVKCGQAYFGLKKLLEAK